MNLNLNSQSTALNLFLINQFEMDEIKQAREQAHVLRSTFYKPIVTDLLPQVTKNTKWANTSINRNLKEFLMHNDLPNSRNVLNDHSSFENAPVLEEGWIKPNKAYYNNLSPRREAPWENLTHFTKFKAILKAVGYDQNNPVCLDKHGRILDGAYRMYVMAELFEQGAYDARIYVRVYDFE